MQIEIKKALLEGHTPEVIVEATKDWNSQQRENFIRRGINVASNYTPKQVAYGFAPVALAVTGGAIGNQIHGDDGTMGGVVYDAQAHNDDEYDGTGALLGLAAGAGLNMTKGVGLQKGDAVIRRLKERTGKVSNDERLAARIYGTAMHGANIADKTSKFFRR